jgi:hypothetical protein
VKVYSLKLKLQVKKRQVEKENFIVGTTSGKIMDISRDG